MTHDNVANLLRRMPSRIWSNRWFGIILFTIATVGTLVCTFISPWSTGGTRSFLAGGGQNILGTTVASILSILIILALAVLWTLRPNSSIGKHIYKYRWIVSAFLVLALLTPVAVLLLRGTSSLWIELAVYVRELLVSVIFVASASTTLRVLARMSYDKASEAEQFDAWKKWLEEDDTGWHELWEEVCFGSELRPAVRSAVKQELRYVRRDRLEAGLGEYEERLRLLLLSPSEVSKLSSAEPVPEQELVSPGFVHSDDFLRHIVANLQKQQGAI